MAKGVGINATPRNRQPGARSSFKASVTVVSSAAVVGVWLPLLSQAEKQRPPWCQRLYHTLPLRVGRVTFLKTLRVFSPARSVRTEIRAEFVRGVPSWT